MKRFPGIVMRDGKRRIILTAEQEAWLARWYPVTENRRLAKAMGISVCAVRSHALHLGVIGKSDSGIAAIRKRQAQRVKVTCERNGYYASKRGKPVSEATREGSRRRWREIREGKRLSPVDEVRVSDPERYALMIRGRSEARKEMIRKEKLRALYGLERKTRLKVVVMKPYTHSQTFHRMSALKRGYLLAEDCSEGSPDRYVIYYDEETERSERFERNCIKDGFTIKKDG